MSKRAAPPRKYQRGEYVPMVCTECETWFRWKRVRKGFSPAIYTTDPKYKKYGICNDCELSGKLMRNLRDAVKTAIRTVKVTN